MLTATRFLIHVVLPTALGTCVYIGWRSTDLLVFRWMEFCGLNYLVLRSTMTLPDWLLYSFPDGCWVYATTSWILIIWKRFNFWTYLAVVLAVGAECGQHVGIVQGTYQTLDIVFYIAGFILAGMFNEKTPLVSTGDDRDGILGAR